MVIDEVVINNEQQKVLIVDDEEPVRKVIRRRLTREGYYCVEARSAFEALDRVRENKPQLVLLDIMMPGRSGLDILPEIVVSSPTTAVIMATAVIEAQTIIECMKNGAQDYITKPFDLEQLVESVTKVLQMKRLELQIREYQQDLEHTVEEQRKEIRKLFMNSIEALVYALEAKDKYTAGHSRRVANIALSVGGELGLSQDELDDLRWGALLHDVGKIAIDPSIQNKPGRLTPGEYKHMMTHALVGVGIVKPVASQAVIEIIAHHHDHYDGTGLDQTTKGEEIPLGARIVAVADSFDAMTSDRPYRVAMSTNQAMAEIERCTGTQFDPVVAISFAKTIVNAGLWGNLLSDSRLESK